MLGAFIKDWCVNSLAPAIAKLYQYPRIKFSHHHPHTHIFTHTLHLNLKFESEDFSNSGLSSSSGYFPTSIEICPTIF